MLSVPDEFQEHSYFDSFMHFKKVIIGVIDAFIVVLSKNKANLVLIYIELFYFLLYN